MGQPISAEAIYQWINAERTDLKSSLLIAGESRRRRRAVAASRVKPQAAAPKRSIDLARRVTAVHPVLCETM